MVSQRWRVSVSLWQPQSIWKVHEASVWAQNQAEDVYRGRNVQKLCCCFIAVQDGNLRFLNACHLGPMMYSWQWCTLNREMRLREQPGCKNCKGFSRVRGSQPATWCVPGKKLSDLERVTSLKVYNWFANRRKEIKRRANIGNVQNCCVTSVNIKKKQTSKKIHSLNFTPWSLAEAFNFLSH